MVDKLFISKTILSNIAAAIKGKTGDSSPIKVKNMPTAIQNIPVGSDFQLDSSITGDITLTPPEDVISAKLNHSFTEDSLTGEGIIKNAKIQLYGDDSLLNEATTDDKGECSFKVNSNDYDVVKTVFAGTEHIKGAFKKYAPDYFKAVFYPDPTSSMLWIGQGAVTGKDTLYFQFEDEEKTVYNSDDPIFRENLDVGRPYTYIFTGNILSMDNSLISGDYKELIIPDTLTSQKDSLPRLFANDEDVGIQLENIQLPDNLTELPDEYFMNCKKLQKINLPELITELPTRCFKDCGSLETLISPSNLKIIRTECFKGCTNLLYLEIPNSVEYVGVNQQKDYVEDWISSEQLKYINIPNGLTNLGEYWFGKNSPIEHIVIPANIKTDKYGHAGWERQSLKMLPNLKSVTFRGLSEPSSGDSSINWDDIFDTYDDDRKINVYIPEDADNSYDDLFDDFGDGGQWVKHETPTREKPIYVWNVNDFEDIGELDVYIKYINTAGEEVSEKLLYDSDEHCYIGEGYDTGEYIITCEEEGYVKYTRQVVVNQEYDNIFYFKLDVPAEPIVKVDNYLYKKNYETGDLDYDNAKKYFDNQRPN